MYFISKPISYDLAVWVQSRCKQIRATFPNTWTNGVFFDDKPFLNMAYHSGWLHEVQRVGSLNLLVKLRVLDTDAKSRPFRFKAGNAQPTLPTAMDNFLWGLSSKVIITLMVLGAIILLLSFNVVLIAIGAVLGTAFAVIKLRGFLNRKLFGQQLST